MTFEKTNIDKIPNRHHKTDLLALLTSFQESGFKVVKLKDHGYAKTSNAVCAINRAAKLYNREHIRAFERNGEIYLVNEVLE